MKRLRPFYLLLILLWGVQLFSQLKLCSWNLQNFGKSKSDSTILFIANTLRDYDVVALVEVVAGKGGAQAVARLADELNRSGAKWDYCISDPTTGTPARSERYAFLWKTKRVSKKGDAWLETRFKAEIEREPYMVDFVSEGKVFTVVVFHALPKDKQPETEIKHFKLLPAEYTGRKLLFCGDFNCPESHSVFGPLKALSFKPVIVKQKTSLKNECKENECLASEYDNIFYNSSEISFVHSGVLHFYRAFSTLKQARKVSDHLPVYFEFTVR